MFDQPTPPDTAIDVPASRLAAICHQLAPAYQRRNTIPVLGTALIEAGPDGTVFVLTDLDIRITVTDPELTCAAPWKACVPFRLLRRMAETLDGMVRVTCVPGDAAKHETHQLTLATEDGLSARINLLCDVEGFPAPRQITDDAEGWHILHLTPAQLRRHLDLALPCISTEETRYYLNGIHLCRQPDGTTLRSVATDGHRMAVIDGQVDAPEGISAIIPTRAVQAMRRVVQPKANEPVTLMLHSGLHHMRLRHGHTQIDCKLINHPYPDYARISPNGKTQTVITLNAATLRRLLPFLEPNHISAVAFHDGRARIKNADMKGEISTPVQMDAVDGHDMSRIGFQLRYLLTQARLTPTFRIEVSTPSDPTPIRSEDPDALWILMPMRV